MIPAASGESREIIRRRIRAENRFQAEFRATGSSNRRKSSTRDATLFVITLGFQHGRKSFPNLNLMSSHCFRAMADLSETDPLQEFDSILHRLGCIRVDNGSEGANLLANRIPLLRNAKDPAVRSIGCEKLDVKASEVPHVQGVEGPAFMCSEFKLLFVSRSFSPGFSSRQQIDYSGPQPGDDRRF